MQKHKFQKQNLHGAVKLAQESFSKKALSILNSPQFEPHWMPTQKTVGSPIQPILQNGQAADILPVFQIKQHRRGNSVIPPTSRTDDRKQQVVSVLEMSFSEETKRTNTNPNHATATFNHMTCRSNVTSCEGKSRFVESRLQRKAEAYEIFNAIKQTQEKLEEKKKQIIKAFAFRPLAATSPKKSPKKERKMALRAHKW